MCFIWTFYIGQFLEYNLASGSLATSASVAEVLALSLESWGEQPS